MRLRNLTFGRTGFLSSQFWPLLVPFWIISSVDAFASNKQLEGAVLKEIPYAESPYVSLEVREKYANVLLAYWKDFDSRVPRLSPSEADWIKQETRTSGERLERAINSREYALFSLSISVGTCLSSLDNLISVYSDPVQAETEMFFWLGMVKCYSNVDGMIRDLHRAELSNGRADGSFHIVGSWLVINTLLDKVVPSAMADTMGWALNKN